MEQTHAASTKLRLATVIRKVIDKNKTIVKNNKAKGIEDVSLVKSLRQLAAASGLDFKQIQTIYAAKRDPQFSSLSSIVDALGLTFTQFGALYDAVTKADVEETKQVIERGKKVALRKTQVSAKSKRNKK